MNEYLIPANAKRGMLILGIMNTVDLIVACTGIGITTILLLILGTNAGVLELVFACMPAVICIILVLPIPNYHNSRVALQSIIHFFNERRNYIWKGWCIYDEYKDIK